MEIKDERFFNALNFMFYYYFLDNSDSLTISILQYLHNYEVSKEFYTQKLSDLFFLKKRGKQIKVSGIECQQRSIGVVVCGRYRPHSHINICFFFNRK